MNSGIRIDMLYHIMNHIAFVQLVVSQTSAQGLPITWIVFVTLILSELFSLHFINMQEMS